MDLKSVSSFLHVLSVVFWVGGMFFAYVCLRPTAAQQLEPPQRLSLWVGVFERFFPYVWASVILLPATGFGLMFAIWNSFAATPLYVHIMYGAGIVMIMIYLHVFFAPYKRLKQAVAIKDWQTGGKQLNQIRILIRTNLILGIVVVGVASGGRYLALLI
ncbi:MAG: CopD family protein [Thioalkalispiraceae bacterium]|jgi:uncharacterized membrane protein